MALQRMWQRRGSSAAWAAANPVLANGELGFDTTLRLLKIGNGTDNWAALPDFTGGAAGASVELPFKTPEDYGAVGDGIADDSTPLQAAMDELESLGGGVLMLTAGKLYGWSGELVQRQGVSVVGNGFSAFGTAPVGLIALNSAARYRYGKLSGDPYPGALFDLTINGANLGGGDELLRIESVDAAVGRIAVVNGVGDGVVFAAAQNTTLDKFVIHNFPNGAGLAFRNRDDTVTNSQGAGHCRAVHGHITAADKLLLTDYVRTDLANPMNFWPHDNMVETCILEQYQDNYHSLVHLRDGEIQFDKTVLTGSNGTGPATADCVMLVENELRPTHSTKVTLTNSYIGGGAAAPTDAIRSNSYGIANSVRLLGWANIANVDYVLCDDRSGGGAGVVGGIRGALDADSGVIAMSRGINGGNSGVFLNVFHQPIRLSMDSAQGDPIQLRNETDSSNRMQITAEGNIKWLNGSDSTVRANIIRSGDGVAINGNTVVQIIGYTTALRPDPTTLLRRIILDVTLGILIWSDGTIWRKVSDGTAA